MKKILFYKYYNFLLRDVYNKSLKHNGFTPNGVCWINKKSQYKRFDILTYLLNKLSVNQDLLIADIGCGYGELLNYFLSKGKNFSYEGYDINKQMIDFCNKKFNKFNFFCKSYPINNCDVSVMSGTYNYAVTDDIILWESYLLYNISRCLDKCRLGLVFNLQFEKNRSIRNSIYYTNISYMFDLLRNKFSKIEKFYSVNTAKDIYFIIYRT